MNSDFLLGMSVDIEDGISITMKNRFGIDIQPTQRVVTNTLRLLELFAKKETLATLFILGEVAETFPFLVKEIVKGGHEIGIHGYQHTHLNNLSPERAMIEIGQAKNIVEDLSGQQVFGYRAPYFSVNEKSKWIFEVLGELGFIYDSSVLNKSILKPYTVVEKNNLIEIKLANKNSVIEIPITTYTNTIFGHAIPVCGGGYLRSFPFCVTKKKLREVLKKQPVIVYTHPYEIDTIAPPTYYQERIKYSSIKTKFSIKRSRYNRSNLLKKLNYLLENYESTSIINLIKGNMTHENH